jgi:hypothetical protein
MIMSTSSLSVNLKFLVICFSKYYTNVLCTRNAKEHCSVWGRHSYLLHANFLHGLLFNPEDEGGMILGNVGWLSTDYKTLYPKGKNSSFTNAASVEGNFCCHAVFQDFIQ